MSEREHLGLGRVAKELERLGFQVKRVTCEEVNVQQEVVTVERLKEVVDLAEVQRPAIE